MNKRVLLVALLLATATPMRADFDGLVRAVSARGLHRVWVPGLGLARFAVWMIHPAGVSDFQLATFKGDAHFNSADVAGLLRANAEAGFRPVVQQRSKGDNETTLIWARPAGGDQVDFMLLKQEGGADTVVMRAVVDAAVFAREVNMHKHHSRHHVHIANR
jgi:hypothetical protein